MRVDPRTGIRPRYFSSPTACYPHPLCHKMWKWVCRAYKVPSHGHSLQTVQLYQGWWLSRAQAVSYLLLLYVHLRILFDWIFPSSSSQNKKKTRFWGTICNTRSGIGKGRARISQGDLFLDIDVHDVYHPPNLISDFKSSFRRVSQLGDIVEETNKLRTGTLPLIRNTIDQMSWFFFCWLSSFSFFRGTSIGRTYHPEKRPGEAQPRLENETSLLLGLGKRKGRGAHRSEHLGCLSRRCRRLAPGDRTRGRGGRY